MNGFKQSGIVGNGGSPFGIDRGVPSKFSRITRTTVEDPVTKGQLSKTSIQARVLNESVESSRKIQGVVDSTNIVGQIFKASKDNTTALMLTLESAGGTLVDNFESYANDAALQAAWVATTALATLDLTTFFSGTQAMSLPTTNNADEWVLAVGPSDFTDFTGVFKALFSHTVSQQQISVFIGDGVNTKSLPLSQDDAGVWCNCEVNEQAMNEDGGGTTNITAITEIGYRVLTKRTGGTVVIDDIFSVPPPGSIEIKLWDMGTDIPVSTTDNIDSGTQYESIGEAQASSVILSLEGGQRLYHIDEFTCGNTKAVPTNELLNIGHYYILELKWIDTNVSVYGPDTSFLVNNYTNGYAFTTPDEATPIAAIGEFSDIMFGIFSTQDIYIMNASWRFDASPNGDSEISVFLEDTNMKMTDIVVDREHSPEQAFTCDASLRPQFLEDGGKLEYYYNDDFTDNVSKINVEMQYVFIPPAING